MNDWSRVKDLFETTVALPEAERERVLDAHQAADGASVATVRAMLAADAAPFDEFDTTAADLLRRLQEDEQPERLCGLRCGAYRFDDLLASGGMAHVYRATRSVAGTERRVACKVLREGLDSESFLARFRAERHVLAGLDHENIVGLLDADTLPDGRPFLVMEFVEGQTLTDWARTRSLSERLQLFVQILATVQYAHSQLVVHRDLKPGNILVTNLGAPRLLDFGVATVLSRQPGESGAPEPLTPVYASPEQLAGDPVTAVSDVFALGVVLRELVTGSPVGEIVSPDLRAIVAKACAVVPSERYRSVAALQEDVRRFRCREPIGARPATWAYRARMFVLRNPWPLALAAVMVVSLAIGWIGAVLDERSARRNASAGWGAHSEAKLTARVFEDWISDVAAKTPELAASAVAHLSESLANLSPDRPEAEVMIRLALARLLLDQGDREAAHAHAERACELAAVTRGVGKRERERAEELRRRTAQ